MVGGRDDATWNEFPRKKDLTCDKQVSSTPDHYARCNFIMTFANLYTTSLMAPSLAYGFHWPPRIRIGAFATQSMAEMIG